ncbi:hypothetical protein [Sphaerospermopsis aphanizomenoides]|uniref:hypothetical protein n=1 Tax=Sphaerospermopsis aphanizomenoides TaxID=459663 RepID=UPI00223ED500|nr:hypothetical protein [Sphaerospermopsis aphanizomenoides]
MASKQDKTAAILFCSSIGGSKIGNLETSVRLRVICTVVLQSEMLNVVTKVYIFSYSSPIKGENVNIS